MVFHFISLFIFAFRLSIQFIELFVFFFIFGFTYTLVPCFKRFFSVDEIKEVEYKLDYTEVYNEYKALFELKIETFIESQGTFVWMPYFLFYLISL